MGNAIKQIVKILIRYSPIIVPAIEKIIKTIKNGRKKRSLNERAGKHTR